MKRIYLSLLPCLASLLASAQEPLNGDSLASDFRYLVKELAATHPDPYSGFGGKVFFYEQAFHLENELRRTPGTKQTFFDKVSIFLSNLQDGHTYLLPPTANQQANQRYLALEVRTIPDGIILQGIPETYKDLLGSREREFLKSHFHSEIMPCRNCITVRYNAYGMILLLKYI